jgi:5-methylcytosine-specific restriction endonuclease McrA
MNLLDTDCLKLNANWQVIDVVKVRNAFEDAAAGAATLLRFHEGYPIPLRLEEWLKIEVDEGQEYVGISAKYSHNVRRIAVPRVMICINYDKFIAEEQKPYGDSLLKHYNYKDAVTGKPLTRERMSREHVRPRSKGGTDGWENVAPMDKELNSKRSNKSYRKVGLKAPKLKKAPKPLLPINRIINKNHYPEWRLFKIPEPNE